LGLFLIEPVIEPVQELKGTPDAQRVFEFYTLPKNGGPDEKEALQPYLYGSCNLFT
jgi:hypothetical protein